MEVEDCGVWVAVGSFGLQWVGVSWVAVLWVDSGLKKGGELVLSVVVLWVE